MYVNLAQFGMIGYLFVRDNSVPIWVIVPMLLCLVFLTLVDWIYVFSPELGRQSEKNPVTIETRNNTREIIRIMKEGKP